MRVIILLPILLYLWVAILNKDLLIWMTDINIFGLTTIKNVPVLLYTIIFFVIYSILLLIFFDSIASFRKRKISKLEKEIFTLKSKLYDEREDELVVFMEEQKRRLEDFLKKQANEAEKVKAVREEHFQKILLENATTLEKQKADTDRILDKLNLLDEWVLDKIKKAFKSK